VLRLLWWLYGAGGTVITAGAIAVILDEIGISMIALTMQVGLAVGAAILGIGMVAETIKAKQTTTNQQQ
jgi:hypothetical protein